MTAGRNRAGFGLALGAAATASLQPVLLASTARADEGSFGTLGGLIPSSPFAIVALSACALISGIAAWAWFGRAAALRAAAAARRGAVELETRLDEAEALIAAEPHLLFVWQGNNPHPERVGGALPEARGVPATARERASFPKWLEISSAEALAQGLKSLKQQGVPFNFVVRTRAGDLLEADGRTAGGLVTLRLRWLTGERLEMSKLAQQYRTLEHEVSMMTGILDQAPMPVWVRDHDQQISWANRAYLRAVDAGSVEQVVDSRLELLDQTHRNRAREALSSCSVARQRAHAVVAGARKNLEVIDVSFEGGSAGFAIDMTDLETAQNELRRHIQAHASTLDKLATAVAIFGPDQRLRFSNAAYSALWSLDTQWLAEQPTDAEILDRLRETRHLPEQADFRAWKARQLAAYTRVEPHEDWWHLPDGQTLRVVSEQHPFGGVTYLYENVTERLELESRYNQLINVQRETLDNLHEGVALFGSDGRLKLYNSAYANLWRLDRALLAETPHIEQIVGRCRAQYDDDRYWDQVRFAVTSLSQERVPLSMKIERLDETVLAFASVPLPDGATLLTFGDITDSARIERALRERAEALEAADQLKSEFVSNVSYELRTPLTNIIGFAEGLSIGLAGALNAKQAEYVNDIQTSSNVLLRVIDAILDLATIDAGAMELRLQEFDVASTVEASRELVRDRISASGHVLELDVAKDVGSLFADEKRVSQILYNLLSNAIGFSEPGSTITLACRREDDQIVLSVSDNGKGIDPSQRDAIFDRFHARSSGPDHRGPGLGLSLVKSFVELHGGTVEVDSEPQHGTTFTCRLPAAGPGTGAVRRVGHAAGERDASQPAEATA
jgi:signal transduction histidine kinase